MTRPHLIARLFFASMGVYLLMRFLSSIYSAVCRLILKCPQDTFTVSIIITTTTGVVALAVSLILLFKSDGLARMITGPDASQCEKVNCTWIITAFRMMACLCGLLILYHRIGLLFFYVPNIINSENILSYLTLEGQSSQLSSKTLAGILVELTKWFFAIYLIFGAPHYVRRQMRVITANTRGEK